MSSTGQILSPVNSVKLTVDNSRWYTWRMHEFIHPEKQDGEIFFTNATRGQFKLMRWSSKRKGIIAYDGEGKQLSYKNWFPIFLKKEELDNVKADLRTERKSWREVMAQLM